MQGNHSSIRIYFTCETYQWPKPPLTFFKVDQMVLDPRSEEFTQAVAAAAGVDVGKYNIDNLPELVKTAMDDGDLAKAMVYQSLALHEQLAANNQQLAAKDQQLAAKDQRLAEVRFALTVMLLNNPINVVYRMAIVSPIWSRRFNFSVNDTRIPGRNLRSRWRSTRRPRSTSTLTRVFWRIFRK